MLSYVYLGSNDLDRAARFYDATLGNRQPQVTAPW